MMILMSVGIDLSKPGLHTLADFCIGALEPTTFFLAILVA